jgi:hypothetical protein
VFRDWLASVRAAVAVVSCGQRHVVLEAWVPKKELFVEDEEEGLVSSKDHTNNDENDNNDYDNDNDELRLLTKAGRFGITVQAGHHIP